MNINLAQVSYGTIIISDNGTGISEEKSDKIFDRFYRVDSHRPKKYGGFGLGLSIVKSIVDENNGKIQVESKVNQGSKFTIYLNAVDSHNNNFSKEILR